MTTEFDRAALGRPLLSRGRAGIAAALSAALLLSACAGVNQDTVAREAAKRTITPIVDEQFPGVDTEVATDCIIDNASAGEILAMAGGAATGQTAATTALVIEIAARPGTVSCIADGTVDKILPGRLGGLL